MTQLFALHSAYGLATASAALDENLLGDHGERILVPFVSSKIPETTVGIAADPALGSLRARFDRMEDLGALLGAQHPSAWKPDAADLPLLQKLFARAWNLDLNDLELLVQSPQVAPAKTLMALFPHARITIIGDGLMTYSPMRVKLAHTVTARIGRVVYADVVPGVTPLVGSPVAVPVPVSPAAFRSALEETGSDESVPTGPATLVLGQYLAALGLMTEREELDLQCRMIDRAAAHNTQRIVFKPHPAAPPRLTDALRTRAETHGVEFVEYRGALAAELLAERIDASLVVAGFSTALPTVRALFGREIVAVGAAELLARLTPYENSNRVPAVIVDALTRADSPYQDPERLQLLVDAVGYAMQPLIAAHLRPRAEEFLAGLDPAERDRYFAAPRLAELQLPGAAAQSPVRRALSSAGGVGRIEELRLTAHGAKRRAWRAWRAIRGE